MVLTPWAVVQHLSSSFFACSVQEAPDAVMVGELSFIRE